MQYFLVVDDAALPAESHRDSTIAITEQLKDDSLYSIPKRNILPCPSNSATFFSRASPSQSCFSVNAASPRVSYSRLYCGGTLCARLCARQICAGHFSPIAICRAHSSLSYLVWLLFSRFSFIHIELYIQFVERLTYGFVRWQGFTQGPFLSSEHLEKTDCFCGPTSLHKTGL
jgi:hypothetical protein